MPKGKVVKPGKVMPFVIPELPGYESRMLIDVFNAGSEKMQVNHGTLKGGASTPGCGHPGHDEIYVVLSGSAILDLDNVEYEIEQGAVVFIPGDTFHSLKNKSQTEDLEIITVWPGQPAPGVNGIYDMRKEAWDTSYREIEE